MLGRERKNLKNPPAGGFPRFSRILAVVTITFIVIVIAPEAGAHEPDTFVNAAQPAVENATALKTAASSSGSDTQKCAAMVEKTLGMTGPPDPVKLQEALYKQCGVGSMPTHQSSETEIQDTVSKVDTVCRDQTGKLRIQSDCACVRNNTEKQLRDGVHPKEFTSGGNTPSFKCCAGSEATGKVYYEWCLAKSWHKQSKNAFCGCYREGVVKNVKAGWFNNDARSNVHKECAVKFPG